MFLDMRTEGSGQVSISFLYGSFEGVAPPTNEQAEAEAPVWMQEGRLIGHCRNRK